MHLIMILLGSSLAWMIRFLGMRLWQWQFPVGYAMTDPQSLDDSGQPPVPATDAGRNNLAHRWHCTLGLFLSAPLLLAMTAIAILWMGPVGQMVVPWEGVLSYGCALMIIGWSGGVGLNLWWQGSRSLVQLQQYPEIDLLGRTSRLIPHPHPYSAQVGFWRSQLVVSQGLLDTLDPDHLEAVLIHEHAHAIHHDTFWFFWLGWLRRLTSWLPYTEFLWQELLILRELRADHHAAQQIDPLLLAESLLTLATVPPASALIPPTLAAAFDSPYPQNRLLQRLTALTTPPTTSPTPPLLALWLLPSLLPLIAIPFHH